MGISLGLYYVSMLGLFLIALLCNYGIDAELTPPYFNLATGRKIYATATCGVGVDEPELYCKLVGANTENDNNYVSVIQGQVCDTCDPSRPDKHHPPENAIDGTEAWWQSPPLSRGMKYNEVNLTIDFGQEFHVAYIFIRMGNSPRPGLWTLEKSTDYGKTWTSWQHFSDTPADCEIYFGRNSLRPITKDDDVICTTEYSKIVPLENGEIPVMLLNNRPSANNYFNSTALQEWTRATNVRIRLLRTKNLLGHLMSVARQDPTVTRRYFYSIKDISIGGRCMCNGHADTCDVLDPTSPVRILACRCQHRTCGIQCNECCPGFEQKKWRQNTNARPFQCEPCNCFGHSNRCSYNESVDLNGLSLDIHGNYEGGGVCQDCQHNTDGINCNKCMPKFYRPYGKYWNETDVCRPCDCEKFYSTGNCEEETGHCECRKEFQKPDCQSCAYGYFGFPNCRECQCNLNGTREYYCEALYGSCPCKENFAGPHCKQCAKNYYNYPICEPCNCGLKGAVDNDCNVTTGQCLCKPNFGGKTCEICKDGYHSYPVCKYCDCDVQGTVDEVCDKVSGQCLCREGYDGPRCGQCLPGYYNYPNCIPCNCSSLGSSSKNCDLTGKCKCLPSFAGKQCTSCSAGYYSYPSCLPCNCNNYGSQGVSCNSEGQCSCLSNFDGKLCDACKEGFYNYPACEECNCDPAGVIPKFAGCGSVPAGELCQCKERVTGRICDQCKPGHWNLNISNPNGCAECDCYSAGTLGTLETCDTKSGQCVCKPAVQGRRCEECKDGSYFLESSSLFGCKDCNCDIGGSRHSTCDKTTGQCSCHQRITGRTCSQPLTTHYFPTLYQFQFEYEDGYTPLSGAHVRYQYNESSFPGFSGKGYAVFSNIQNEVINEVKILKSSVYRMVIRYHNPTDANTTATILITSDNPLELDQTTKVLFRPTYVPQFVTVSGAKGDKPSPIVLDPGSYTFSIKTDKNILLDYFVLLPAAYYEASILTRKIETPCQLDELELCRNYRYPSVEQYEQARQPFIPEGIKPKDPSEWYDDAEHLKIISYDAKMKIPLLSGDTKSLKYPVIVPKTGRYIIVVDYISHRDNPNMYFINVRIDNSISQENSDNGVVILYPCLYSMICRQPVFDDVSLEKIFFIDEANQFPIEIYHRDIEDGKVAIVSVTAIPVEEWSVDFIKPSSVCVVQNGECVPSVFRIVPDSKKIEVEYGNEDRISPSNPEYIKYDDIIKLIYLSHLNPTIEIQSKAAEPGRYVIIVQYYQPNHPKFQVPFRLSAGKQIYDGKFDVNHCPSSAGCRGIIRPEIENLWFDIEDEFNITLTNNRTRGLWLDYLLLVSADQYNDDLLKEETFDQTKAFIRQCGQDHFHIQLNASEFCRKAVFSLTADYNSGALECNCNYDGSHSFECDPFGGQCQCKPNVIGRRCEACRPGYWGFPDCKPCDCPFSLCEKDTGKCICPRNVIGEKCDQCEPFTYGYHQIIGCEECNCNPRGVERGNLQCDMINGSCSCRENIEGRACEQCSHGFYNFPRCDRCRCNTGGTTFEVCDKVDESCFCKKNVVGRYCDKCDDGTFNLQHSNPEGCTQCFCFGKTTRCESAFLRVFNISLLKNVSLNTVQFSDHDVISQTWSTPLEDILINETTLQVNDFTESDGFVYFGVLDFFATQNNHLTAYGGYLVYTLYYTTALSGRVLYAPDIIFYGKDRIIIHESYEQPPSNQHFTKTLKIVEESFKTWDKKPVSRADLMMVLRDLQSIFIRANYEEPTVLSQLSDVYLTIGAEDEENYHDYKELPVEKCHCPQGYSGLSCENCTPGFYRVPDGPFGGYCVPCQCHGHADTCDCNTGICKDCMHYTTGDHCEKCIEGYHGNATYGNPHDCVICACPLPYDSNNFATSCEISETGSKIHCECKPGYTGPQCESCAAGFYGQPRVLGDYCKPCDCSGNIDPTQEGSCDTITGDCVLCLNNTYGRACNLCAPGFYGDAIKLKDCKACDCDDFGTAYCNSSTGICNCHENVIGEKCDKCKPDHYGHASGLGCRPCNCGFASNSMQCDDLTGECLCKPGVAGRQCDRCAIDHWNYTADGCIPCSCNKGFSRGFGCNALTGQCECLPGVIGEKCDACPLRWVLEKDRGCFECDVCHHALLNVTDDLYYVLDPVFHEFQTTARAHFTLLKLENYKSTAENLKPKIKALDSTSINLDPSKQKLVDLEVEIKNLTKRISYVEQNSKENSEKVGNLVMNAEEVLNLSRSVGVNARNTIRNIENLAYSFDTSVTTKTENAKNEAESILHELDNKAIDLGHAEEQLNNAITLTQTVEEFVLPGRMQAVELDLLVQNISEFNNKLNDLKNWSMIAFDNSGLANKLNEMNKRLFDASKFDTVANQTSEIERNNKETENLAINDAITFGAITVNLDKLTKIHDDLKEKNRNAHEMLPKADDKFNYLKNRIDTEAFPHAWELNKIANDLANQYLNIKENSGKAISAVDAYSNIYNAVLHARNITTEAKEVAGNATKLGDGLEKRAGKSNEDAKGVLDKAYQALRVVQMELQPHLINSTKTVEKIMDLNNATNGKLTEINNILEQLPKTSAQSLLWDEAADTASDAVENAGKTVEVLSPITKQINLDVEKAKNISKGVDNTDKDIGQIRNNVIRVLNLIPDLKKFTETLHSQQKNASLIGNDLGYRIQEIKRQIETAREIANSIKVGVTFDEKTVLELKTPETVPLLHAESKISMFFNTSNPNGFLMYLGNDNKTGAYPGRSSDFMAIEIENGYPVLIIDLGNGPEKIINRKYVADGKWYQAIVDRTGNNVKFTIREQIGESNQFKNYDEVKGLEGQFASFNLDKNSRLFVGGYSPEFIPPDDITKSSFQGQIEGLKIGNEEVGLWNFVDAENNYEGAQGRNTFIVEETQETGYRFNGNGYIAISSNSYNLASKASIKFNFKASRESGDGLMFYAGRHRDFISIELDNGGLKFQYKLGEHLIMIQTSLSYALNDDNWHTVIAARVGSKGTLQIDDNQPIQSTEQGLVGRNELHISEYIYFGGVPGGTNHSEIVSRSFDGCIDNVEISQTTVDLSKFEMAYGVRAGCPEKFSTVVSYPPGQYGFLKKSNIHSDNYFQIHLEFKTRQREGVIFYATNNNQSSSIGLTIHEGILVLRSARSEVTSGLKRYNDGQLYTVTVTHDRYRLRLTVNDYDAYELPLPYPLLIKNGDIYFGGLPKNFRPPKGALSTLAYFAGCLSRVTLNGQIVNFANTSERMFGQLDNCPPDILAYDVSSVPLFYPGEDVETHIIPSSHRPIDGRFPIPEHTTIPHFPPVTIMTEMPPVYSTERRRTTTITTTLRPIPTKPKPLKPLRKDESCALPIDPQYDYEFTSGFRFGTKAQSRLEVAVTSKQQKKYDITFDFKTSSPDGLLFYGSDAHHLDFFTLYIRDGKIHHVLRCDTDQVELESIEEYNDDNWHKVQFSKNNTIARLLIDGQDFIGEPRCKRQMNLQTPLYFGGVSPGTQSRNITGEVIRNIKFESGINYIGCLRNIQIGGKFISSYSPHNLISCYEDVETGVFFGAEEDSFVKLRQNFTVGTEQTITFEMRPRMESGLILSVHGGKTNYFMLQLYKGSLYFNVMTAGQELEVKFSLAQNESFCDGQWRKVQAIKSLYVITLAVNDISATPAIGNATKIHTNTNRPLFLGGHQFLRQRNRVYGIKARKPYYGCIRNIKIGDNLQTITPQMTHGDVWLGVCPLN